MFFISILGLFLRLSNFIKPEGLWNDEYVSWMVSSTPFEHGFWNAVLKQCHMPLYYLYLKPFSGFSDLILRSTSVIPSVLSIIVMYYAGKEYSKKTGIIAASITSVLSFLVYYAQEVRFYSILFLFSAFSLLYTIRLIKEKSAKNICGYLISNVLIISTHILGIIYVFFNILYVSYKKHLLLTKKHNVYIFVPIVILCLAGVNYGENIIRQIPVSQWWGIFSYTNILFLFSDFLSPILTNHINAPPVFFYDIKLAIWLTVPTLLGLIGMGFGVKQNKGIALISLLVIFTMSALSISGKLVFITKYLIEILPVFIILISCGFVRMQKLGLIIFSIFIAFHLASYFTPNYVTKKQRPEGNNIVGQMLNYVNPDVVLFNYYEPERFRRYFNIDNKEVYYISKSNRFEYRDKPSRLLDEVKRGKTVSMVFLDSVSFVPDEYKNDENIPEMFRTFSEIKNKLILYFNSNYFDFKVLHHGAWTVITGTKKN